jgi:adenylate cyclase
MTTHKGHDYLLSKLKYRDQNPDRGADIDQEVWAEVGCVGAVLISDTAGFTRLTEKCGVIHALALIQRGVDIARPIINEHKGIVIKQEADNMVNLFPSVNEALNAAVSINQALARHNATLDNPDLHTRFSFGMDWGKVLKLSHDIFGAPVNIASKLGEDTASGGEILLSKASADLLKSTPQGCSLGPWTKVSYSGVELTYRHAITNPA